MSTLTEEQLKQLEQLNVKCSSSTGGFQKYGENMLHWGFDGAKLHATFYYEARDADGDWGTAATRHNALTFDELLERIKRPFAYFNTRSFH